MVLKRKEKKDYIRRLKWQGTVLHAQRTFPYQFPTWFPRFSLIFFPISLLLMLVEK